MKKYLYILGGGIVFIIMYLMNLYTPESIQDDYVYKFVRRANDDIDIHSPIQNLHDVLVSQYYHYLYHSGRFIPHFFLQFFDGIVGKDIFNVINAIFFCGLLLLINKVATAKLSFFNCVLTYALVFFLIPSFKETSLWFTGSFNYLWTMVISLLFLYLLKINWNKSITWTHWLIGLLCLFLGWTNEAVVIPVGMVVGWYALFNIRKIYKRAITPLIFFYLIGVALTVFSPAVISNVAKTGEGDGMSLSQRFITIGVALTQLRLFWLFVLGFIFLKFKNKESFSIYISRSWIYICIALCSILVFFIADCHYARVRYAAEIYSLLAFIALLEHCRIPKSLSLFGYALGLAAMICSIIIVGYSRINYSNYLYCHRQLSQPNKTIILTKTDSIPEWADSYVMRHVDFCKKDVWYYGCNKDRIVGAAYGKNYIQYIPKVLYDDILNNSKRYIDFNDVVGCNLYARQVSDDSLYRVKYNLHRYDYNKLFPLFRPVAKHISRYSSRVSTPRSSAVIKINNKNYLVIVKPVLQEERERIKSIECF